VRERAVVLVMPLSASVAGAMRRAAATSSARAQFDEDPKYAAYVALFEPLCGPGPQRPILLEDKARVGQKRGRDSAEDETLEIVRSPAAHTL
jgi:hypothetical protein